MGVHRGRSGNLKFISPISTRFLDEERSTLGDPFFRQEYLCEFLDDETSLFTEEALLAILRDDIPPVVPEFLRHQGPTQYKPWGERP